MTKTEKLLERFKSRPKDFTYGELKTLLTSFDYSEIPGSGSRVDFLNKSTKRKIKIHKPHPGNELKRYQIDMIISFLKTNKLI